MGSVRRKENVYENPFDNGHLLHSGAARVFSFENFRARPVFRRAHLCVCPHRHVRNDARDEGRDHQGGKNRHIRVCRRLYPRLRAVRAVWGHGLAGGGRLLLRLGGGAFVPAGGAARGNLAAKSRRRLSLRGISHPPFSASHLDQSSVGSARFRAICAQFRSGDFVRVRHFSLCGFAGVCVRSVFEIEIPQKDGPRRQPQ